MACARCRGRGWSAGTARLGSPAFCGLGASADGMTLVFRDGDAAPVAFRFADRMREDAPAAIAALGSLGLSAELLSGDGEGAVAAVAWQAGIAKWRSGVDPLAKQARIEALRDEGRHPLMVGDGINDAAALAAGACLGEPGRARRTWRRPHPTWCCSGEGLARAAGGDPHRAAGAVDRARQYRLLAGL